MRERTREENKRERGERLREIHAHNLGIKWLRPGCFQSSRDTATRVTFRGDGDHSLRRTVEEHQGSTEESSAEEGSAEEGSAEEGSAEEGSAGVSWLPIQLPTNIRTADAGRTDIFASFSRISLFCFQYK